jgi:hypothetical protein
MSEQINIVAFKDADTVSQADLLLALRSTVKDFSGKPLIVVFPEVVLGEHATHRSVTKNLAAEINSILSSHGNAFVFMSLFERMGRGEKSRYSNTGYIVTPSRKKRWIVYPKISTMTNMDYEIIESTAYKSSSVNNLISHWAKRASKIRSFPQIHLEGKTIQLRVCADIYHPDLYNSFSAQFKHTTPDLVIVPASGLKSRNVVERNRTHWSTRVTREGGALVVDGHHKRVSRFSKNSDEGVVGVSKVLKHEGDLSERVLKKGQMWFGPFVVHSRRFNHAVRKEKDGARIRKPFLQSLPLFKRMLRKK